MTTPTSTTQGSLFTSTHSSGARTNGFQLPLHLQQVLSGSGQICFTTLAFLVFALYAEPSFAVPVACGIYAVPVTCLVMGYLYCSIVDPALPGGFACPCMRKTQEVSRYCSICKKVVPGLDHHCKWLNTCIGRRNYWAFYIIAVAGTVQYILQVVFALLTATAWKREDVGTGGVIFAAFVAFFGLVGIVSFGSLSLFHTYLLIEGIGTYDWLLRRNARRLQKEQEYARKARTDAAAAAAAAASGGFEMVSKKSTSAATTVLVPVPSQSPQQIQNNADASASIANNDPSSSSSSSSSSNGTSSKISPKENGESSIKNQVLKEVQDDENDENEKSLSQRHRRVRRLSTHRSREIQITGGMGRIAVSTGSNNDTIRVTSQVAIDMRGEDESRSNVRSENNLQNNHNNRTDDVNDDDDDDDDDTELYILSRNRANNNNSNINNFSTDQQLDNTVNTTMPIPKRRLFETKSLVTEEEEEGGGGGGAGTVAEDKHIDDSIAAAPVFASDLTSVLDYSNASSLVNNNDDVASRVIENETKQGDDQGGGSSSRRSSSRHQPESKLDTTIVPHTDISSSIVLDEQQQQQQQTVGDTSIQFGDITNDAKLADDGDNDDEGEEANHQGAGKGRDQNEDSNTHKITSQRESKE